MKILAIGTRPGEVELGCGGCLINSHSTGNQLFVYVLSDNGWHSKGRRYVESLRSVCNLFEPASLWVDNFTEDELLDSAQVVKNLRFFIRLVKPELILSPSQNDSNLQRREVANQVVEASESRQNLIAYELLDSGSFRPQAYCDISKVLADKLRLCNAFFAEDARQTSGINALARKRASDSGLQIPAAEAFEIVCYHFSKSLGIENTGSKFHNIPFEAAAKSNHIIEYASIHPSVGKASL